MKTDDEVWIDGYERWKATYLSALFAGALFDQVLLPEVAAGVDWTGRVRYTPFARAGRSAASDQLVLWGDAEARQAEFGRLRSLHRDVHGVSPEGVRFSALAPEAWNWILISTMFMYLNSYAAVSSRKPSAAELQVLWTHGLEQFEGLQLTGSQRLPEKYAEAVDYYDEMIRTKARRTEIFGHVTGQLRQPVAPAVPAILRPALGLVGRVVIRPVAVLSIGITHPGVREIAGHRWTRRHQIEFSIYAALVRVAYQRLPRRLVFTPLAYNRWRYHRIVARYQGAGLDSFAPEGSCPIVH